MEHEPDDDQPLLRSTRLPPAPAALRAPADDAAARARDLREALDELRAELDGSAGRARVSKAAASTPITASPDVSPAGPPAEAAGPPAVEQLDGPPAEPAVETPHGTPPGASAAVGEPSVAEPSVAEPSVAEPSVADPSVAEPSVAGPAVAGPADASSPPARRARVAVLAVAALAAVVLAGVGIVRVVAWSMGAVPDGSSATTAPRSSSPASASAGTGAPASTPSVSASPPSPGPLGPAIALPAAMPVSGPGADSPGADAFVVLATGGAVDVWERLVVRPGTNTVRLQPAPTSALPATADVRLSDVQVAVDGRRVTPRGDGAGWQVDLPGGSFAQVVVRYRLTGALVRVTPAPPGRATLVLRPVTGPAAAAADDPVVVRLADPRVGAVYCPDARTPLCAVSRGSTHVATVPAGTAPVVLAQVTLR